VWMEMSLVTGDMVTRSKSVIPIANADITTQGKVLRGPNSLQKRSSHPISKLAGSSGTSWRIRVAVSHPLRLAISH
jgi:hypothetical protein